MVLIVMWQQEKRGLFNVRHSHEKLLIGIALQFWLGAQSLRPRLLNDGLSRISARFVERGDVVKVDLLVQRRLQSRRDVV